MKFNNQKGFTLTAVVLAVLVLGCVGGAISYVVISQRDSSKRQNSVVDDSTASPKQDESKKSDGTTNEYLEIKEWSVKAKVPRDFKNITYEYVTPKDYAPAGSIKLLTKYDTKLEAEHASYIGAWGIYRWKINDLSGSIGETDVRIQDTYRAKNGMLKVIGEYFYALHYPQMGPDDPEADKMLDEVSKAASSIFDSLEAY